MGGGAQALTIMVKYSLLVKLLYVNIELFLVNYRRLELSVDISLLIRHRLEELGFEQKDLAAAAQVTESYISQLLARKKSPPAPDRTDIYEKMGKFLKLSSGKLAELAELQRKETLKKNFENPP